MNTNLRLGKEISLGIRLHNKPQLFQKKEENAKWLIYQQGIIQFQVADHL